ncbi:MAG: PHP domain-containing protein, partial [Pseudomonadota bacterium]
MFSELAATTNFTFLTGASHPEEMVTRAAELGLDAIAITDRNTLAGVVRAHVRLKELRREHVSLKPRNITGSDVREHAARVSAIRSQVRIDPSSRQPDAAPTKDDADSEPEILSIPKLIIGARLVLTDTPVELVALVTDRAAYGRLCRLLTVGKLRAPKGECYLTFSDVAEWAEGLILIAMVPDMLDREAGLNSADDQASRPVGTTGQRPTAPPGGCFASARGRSLPSLLHSEFGKLAEAQPALFGQLKYLAFC